MQVPLEISFHGVSRSDWSDAYIRERAERLERFCDNIISCRVAVERPHHQHRTGNPYRVRVELTLPPNKDLVATKELSEEGYTELRTVIRSAFDAMERQLKETVERRRYDVKVHEEPRALVVRLFSEQGYGFIRSPDGQEYYFHRNSVLHNDFDRLEVGTEVRFVGEMGEQGPQASTVQIINKPGAREAEGSPLGPDIPPGQR